MEVLAAPSEDRSAHPAAAPRPGPRPPPVWRRAAACSFPSGLLINDCRSFNDRTHDRTSKQRKRVFIIVIIIQTTRNRTCGCGFPRRVRVLARCAVSRQGVSESQPRRTRLWSRSPFLLDGPPNTKAHGPRPRMSFRRTQGGALSAPTSATHRLHRPFIVRTASTYNLGKRATGSRASSRALEPPPPSRRSCQRVGQRVGLPEPSGPQESGPQEFGPPPSSKCGESIS